MSSFVKQMSFVIGGVFGLRARDSELLLFPGLKPGTAIVPGLEARELSIFQGSWADITFFNHFAPIGF